VDDGNDPAGGTLIEVDAVAVVDVDDGINHWLIVCVRFLCLWIRRRLSSLSLSRVFVAKFSNLFSANGHAMMPAAARLDAM
jgi:hypothetical protein